MEGGGILVFRVESKVKDGRELLVKVGKGIEGGGICSFKVKGIDIGG